MVHLGHLTFTGRAELLRISRKSGSGASLAGGCSRCLAELSPNAYFASFAVCDSKKAITLALSSADASPLNGFILFPGTICSGLAMKSRWSGHSFEANLLSCRQSCTSWDRAGCPLLWSCDRCDRH